MTVSARYTIFAALALALPSIAAADTNCCKGASAPTTLRSVSMGPTPAFNSGVFTGPSPSANAPSRGGGCAGCGGHSGGGAGGVGGVTGGGIGVHVTAPVINGPNIVAPMVNVPAPTVFVSHSGPSAPHHLNMQSFNTNTSSGSFVVFGGGGGGGFGDFGPAPSAPFNLTADANTQTESRAITRLAALQAFCIDDRGAPHPASQTFGEKVVDGGYRGEIYRCMAGTKMRVQVGKVENGEAKFQGASTLECAKNEALAFDGERIACRTQDIKRPCNERSLLRRHGPGLKLITLRAMETIQSPRPSVAMTSAPVVGMHFDGGVGAGGW